MNHLATERASIVADSPVGIRSGHLSSKGEENQETAEAKTRKLPELYYYEGKYYRKNSQGTFTSIMTGDARIELKYLGYGKNKIHNEASETDVALRSIQLDNCVQGAGPLCGRSPGLVAENGIKYLVTRGLNLLPAKDNASTQEAKPMLDLLEAVFGGEKNPHYETQLVTFFAWLQRARIALGDPNQHLPGQMLILVGPAGCGKTYLQHLITKMLGGRECDPSLWLQDKTPFNGNLWEAEHLLMSDSNLEASGKTKNAMRDKIKELVANQSYPCHHKNKEQLTLRPIWRITLSANDDATSANILPALENSTSDKIIYFKCYTKEGFFPDSERRQEHHNAIVASIPAFLHFIESAVIPEDLKNNRWGVKAWHHPDCIGLLESYNPEQELEEILEKWLEDKSMGTIKKRIRQLYVELDTLTGGSLVRCSKSTNHLGHQLARLREREPWNKIISKTTEREGFNRNKAIYYEFDASAFHGVEMIENYDEVS